jgi:hypothetical protein
MEKLCYHQSYLIGLQIAKETPLREVPEDYITGGNNHPLVKTGSWTKRLQCNDPLNFIS